MKPNPQGKGSLSLLRDLNGSTHGIPILPKDAKEVLTELFTSLFVLRSDFKFRPVVGRSYWLYHVQERFKLYQFSPEEWGNRAPGRWVGCCALGSDLTWSVEINPNLPEDSDLMTHIREQKQAWEEEVEKEDQMEDLLPEHLGDLPYHQRVMAYGLGKSLRASLEMSGQLTLQPSKAQPNKLNSN